MAAGLVHAAVSRYNGGNDFSIRGNWTMNTRIEHDTMGEIAVPVSYTHLSEFRLRQGFAAGKTLVRAARRGLAREEGEEN